MPSSGSRTASFPAWKTDSFPPIDARVGWALSVVCILIALLLTVGILQVQIGPVSGAALVAIAAAQFGAAFVVAAWARRRGIDAASHEESSEMEDDATHPPV